VNVLVTAAQIRRGAMAEPTTTIRDLLGREPRELAEFVRERFWAPGALNGAAAD
jgi:hypothetical protein